METVIIIPYDGLYAQRERTKMTLMCYGSNKLHQEQLMSSVSLFQIQDHSTSS